MFRRASYLTPVIWLLGWISFLIDISSELLYPVLPVYLQSIGYSFLYIGLLEGIAEATAGLSKGYFGRWSDKLQRRVPFVQAGYGFSAIGKILMAVTQASAGIFMARFTDRLGKGVRTAARDALLAGNAAKENMTSVFGFHRAMDTAGAATGPVIALLILYFYPGNYRLIFIIAIIPALLSVLATIFLRNSEMPAQRTLTARNSFFEYIKYWKRAGSGYKRLVVLLIVFALVNSADVFLILRAKSVIHSDQKVIALYILYNLAYALLAFPAGIIADRYGKTRTLAVSFIFFSLVYALMPSSETTVHLAALFIVYALFASFNESVAKSVIAVNAPLSDRATALGFYDSFKSISMLAASVWTGWLWATGHISMAFYISAAVSVLVFMLLIINRKYQIE